MIDGQEIKIVFTGPMGAGKTTAIAAISDIELVSTETENNDRFGFDKDTTTVALDYGELAIDEGARVRLYGTPGQERFRFMWEILADGALGVVLLLDASHPEVLVQLDNYLAAFPEARASGCLVIGVGRCDAPAAMPLQRIQARMELGGDRLPVFRVDARRREDVILLVETLLSQLESLPQSTEAP